VNKRHGWPVAGYAAASLGAFRAASTPAVVGISNPITTTLPHLFNRAGIDARMAIVVERGDVARAGELPVQLPAKSNLF
jgi:hypothetical protein